MKRAPLASTVLGLLVSLLFPISIPAAQDAPFHAQERDRIDLSGVAHADVWGDGTLAVVGRFGEAAVDLVDASNPDNLSIIGTYVVPSPNQDASAQDIKIGRSLVDPSRRLLFIGLESGGLDGVEIVDVTNPAAPQHLTNIDAEPGSYEFIHNLSYSNGWLALNGGGGPTIALVDLRGYDPGNPPGQITSWAYEIANLGTLVHDMTLTADRLYISAWGSLIVYDVSDLGNQAPAFLAEVPAINSHAVWATDDGRFLVSAEEREGGGLRLYELVDDGIKYELHQRDSYVNPAFGTGATYSTHNLVFVDDLCYVSNYAAGVIALQLDRTTKTWEPVASFDTTFIGGGAGYSGCWGIYPFLGHDRILASDRETGLFTLDFGGLEISHPSTRPLLIAPGTSTPISIDVRGKGNEGIAGVELMASVDGGPFTPTAMTNTGGTTYTAALPTLACGESAEYYFSADGTSGDTYTSPVGAPADLFRTYGGTGLTTILADDFETDQGWTVTGSAPDGAWERADPEVTPGQPGSGDPEDPGDHCYITGAAGGLGGDDDVEGGPTRLVSPNLDFSGGDGLIRYERWYFNNNADPTDALVIEVSGDGGSAWTPVETVTLKAGGWTERAFRVSDFVTPSSGVRVRFSVSDTNFNSITEAGVDTFVASTFECGAGPAAAASTRNGTGVNSLCYSNLTLPVLGTAWDTQIDHSAHANATSTIVVIKGNAVSGAVLPQGEILVGNPKYFRDAMASAGTADTHSLGIPLDVSFAGIFAATQGVVVFGAGGFELCNAIDITIGF